MNPDAQLEKWRRANRARWEAVQEVEDWELATMSDEQAFAIILSLNSFEEVTTEQTAWSGLVEQQKIFQRGRGKA